MTNNQSDRKNHYTHRIELDIYRKKKKRQIKSNHLLLKHITFNKVTLTNQSNRIYLQLLLNYRSTEDYFLIILIESSH